MLVSTVYMKTKLFVIPHFRTIEEEPIDIVYTWVNGSDPAHEALVLAFQRSTLGSSKRYEKKQQQTNIYCLIVVNLRHMFC